MIAFAGMYEWTASLGGAWRRLLDWVAVRYPWARRRERLRAPVLLAAPVPSLPRYGGRAIYWSDFVVRADSPHWTLEDTFGGRLAFSTEDSHSGYSAARHHLLAYRSAERPALYANLVGPCLRQRAAIQAVLDGEADVVPVDGYALDLLRRHKPATTARLPVVATTAPAPIPPFVASPGVDPSVRARITDVLLSAHEAPELAATLDELLLVRFVTVDPADYGVFLDRAREASAAGYDRLG
jgi:ABC-type phosphate/phosphonate transport system substrate-binding protein